MYSLRHATASFRQEEDALNVCKDRLDINSGMALSSHHSPRRQHLSSASAGAPFSTTPTAVSSSSPASPGTISQAIIRLHVGAIPSTGTLTCIFTLVIKIFLNVYQEYQHYKSVCPSRDNVFLALLKILGMVQESAAASKYPGQRSQTQTRSPPPRPPPHQPTHQNRQMQRMLQGGGRQRLGGFSGSSG
ncbi:hypothetical protein MTO96_026922 [Rhipicephalus appendiculatus]